MIQEPASPTLPQFVICGMPRSGTTLLAELISRQPGLTVSAESHLLAIAAELGIGWCPSVRERQRLIEAMIANDACTLDASLLGRGLDQVDSSPSQLVDFMFWLIRRDEMLPAGVAIGEKTPRHIDFVQRILETTTNTLVIGIVRDPRDVQRSLRKVPWSDSTPIRIGLRWARSTRALDAAKEGDHGGRIRIVRFEDLVADSDLCTNQLVAWLRSGAGPSEALGEQPLPSHTFDPETEPWKARAFEAADPNSGERYRLNPSRRDALVAHAASRRLLQSYGYQPASRSGFERIVLWVPVTATRIAAASIRHFRRLMG